MVIERLKKGDFHRLFSWTNNEQMRLRHLISKLVVLRSVWTS